MESSILQSILSEYDLDVLLLYDCCYAVPNASSIQGGGVMEYLVACGFEQGVAAEVGEHSFTNCLIQELGAASYGSISIVHLYERMMARLQNWMPCIDKDASGQMKLDATGKPLFEHPRRRTPIHGILTSEVRRRSILLSPVSWTFAVPLFHDTNTPDFESIESSRKRRRGTGHAIGATASKIDSSIEYTHVILSIRVSTPNFDINSRRDWIRDASSEGTGVKVECIYNSFSTLMLLRMSITTWAPMPDNPAYSFVGFVTSENLAPKFKEQEPVAVTSEYGDTQRATTQDTPHLVDVAEDGDIAEDENDMLNLLAMMDLLPKIVEEGPLESPSEYGGSQGTILQKSSHTRETTQQNLGAERKSKIQDVAVDPKNSRRKDESDKPVVTATKTEQKKSKAEKETLHPAIPYTFSTRQQTQYYGVTLWTCVSLSLSPLAFPSNYSLV
jgi:hypothetical protein